MTEPAQSPPPAGPPERAPAAGTRVAAQPAVAIVGAGISGLACARALAPRGVTVTIFEKSRGVGGRAATRRADTGRGAVAFDHGAQYFTARDPAFAAEVDALAARALVALWAGRIAVLDHGLVHEAGGPAAAPRRWVAVPGMSALGGALATGLDVRLGARIVAIHPHGRRWRLELESAGEPGSFDAVVVATPAPQSAPLLAAAAPPLALAASAAIMTPCWSVMLAVDAPLPLPFDGAFVGTRAPGAAMHATGSGAAGPVAGPAGSAGSGSPLSWVARDSSKPGRIDAHTALGAAPETWVLHATADWSAAHLERAAGEVADELVAAFAEAAGLPPIGPRFVAAHRWRYATPAPGLAEPYLFDRAARVGACGDWCGGARVEGAYLSGLALAGELLAALV